MAFISKVHNFSGDFQTPATTLPMWYDETAPNFFDNYGMKMPPGYDITTPLSRSSSWKTSFPERFGLSEMVVPTSPTGFNSIPIGSDYQKIEKDDYFCSSGGYSTNSWSSYPTATANWVLIISSTKFLILILHGTNNMQKSAINDTFSCSNH